MSIETEIGTLISNVGFPITMAAYLLFKFEHTINKNTQALNKLRELHKK